MQQITPEEATELAYNTTGMYTINHAKAIFDCCYQARLGGGAWADPLWARQCAAAACYVAGRIDGIRAERERRRKAHPKTTGGRRA